MEEKRINLTHDCPLAEDVKKRADIMRKECAKYELEQFIGKAILEEIKTAGGCGKRNTFVLTDYARCKGVQELYKEDMEIVFQKLQGMLINRGFKADYFYNYEMPQRVIFHISWDNN